MQDAMQNARKAMKDFQGGEQVKVVPFLELQEFLPEKLASFGRQNNNRHATSVSSRAKKKMNRYDVWAIRNLSIVFSQPCP